MSVRSTNNVPELEQGETVCVCVCVCVCGVDEPVGFFERGKGEGARDGVDTLPSLTYPHTHTSV